MSPVLRASPVSTWTRLVRQTQDSNAGQPKSRDVAGDPEVVGHLLGRQAAGDVTGYQPQPGTVLLPGERNPEVLHRRLVGPPNSAPAGGQSCYKRKPSAGSPSMVNPTPHASPTTLNWRSASSQVKCATSSPGRRWSQAGRGSGADEASPQVRTCCSPLQVIGRSCRSSCGFLFGSGFVESVARASLRWGGFLAHWSRAGLLWWWSAASVQKFCWEGSVGRCGQSGTGLIGGFLIALLIERLFHPVPPRTTPTIHPAHLSHHRYLSPCSAATLASSRASSSAS